MPIVSNRYVRGEAGRRRGRGRAFRVRAFPVVDVAQRRRSRLRRLAAGAQRASRGGACRLLRPGPLQPATPRCRRWFPISARSIRRRLARARQRYACFDLVSGGDPQAYGYAAEMGIARSCEDEAVRQLVDLRRSAPPIRAARRPPRPRRLLLAEQNARLVRNAEEYYRSMFRARILSWNLRDQHMAETLEALKAFLSTASRPAKVVVWEHNSHVGDARATEIGRHRRVERRTARPAAPRGRRLSDRVYDVRRHGDGRVRLARPRRAQARATCSGGQLRSALSRGRLTALLSPPRSERRRASPRNAPARARHRRDLPSGNGAGQPLLFTHPFPNSSTPCSTSTGRGRSNRVERNAEWKGARSPRPSRRESEARPLGEREKAGEAGLLPALA